MGCNPISAGCGLREGYHNPYYFAVRFGSPTDKAPTPSDCDAPLYEDFEDMNTPLIEAKTDEGESPLAFSTENLPVLSTVKENIMPVSQPTWPTPNKAMYYGLPGDIVRTVEPHTESDPVAILVQLLVMFGNMIGRAPYFPVEADRHYTNIYAVLVGASSKARKGTSAGQVKRIVGAIDPDWLADRQNSGLSSGEGLIWDVRDPVVKKQKGRGTDAKTEDVYDAGIDDKRLLVVETEFASLLRTIGRRENTLSAVIRNAWDSGDLSTMTKNSPARAHGAHISIIGHITAHELKSELSNTDAGNGFANRFLWVCVKRSKELPEGGNLKPEDLSPLIERLKEATDFAKLQGELRRDYEAREYWRSIYHDLSEGHSGLFGAVTSRGEAQTMRLALLYALLDSSPCIRLCHLQAGYALWRYCENSSRHIFGASLGDPVADKILNALKEEPKGMSRSQISGIFGRNLDQLRIGSALDTLVRHKLADDSRTETSGKPAEVWRAL